jgi:hypothetical protein
MNGKILAVLVVVSLALSVLNLVLLLTMNSGTSITNVIQGTGVDAGTVRADSFEMKLQDYRYIITRDTLADFHNFADFNQTQGIITYMNVFERITNETAFLDQWVIANKSDRPPIYRVENTFTYSITEDTAYKVNVKKTDYLYTP